MLVKCLIAYIKIHCLIDAGSTISVLHSRKFDVLPASVKSLLKPSKQLLCMANGETISTVGNIDLPILLGGVSMGQQFTVADIDVHAVIGYDFMHKHKFMLYLRNCVLTVNGTHINLTKQSQMSSV